MMKAILSVLAVCMLSLSASSVSAQQWNEPNCMRECENGSKVSCGVHCPEDTPPTVSQPDSRPAPQWPRPQPRPKVRIPDCPDHSNRSGPYGDCSADEGWEQIDPSDISKGLRPLK
jgi:hypothetical protein